MSKSKIDERLRSLTLELVQPKPPLPIAKKPPIAEKERTSRHDAFKFGELQFATGEKHSCLLQNVSDSGARVKLGWAAALPNLVWLSIPSAGMGRNAKVCWQSGAHCGLQFID